MRFAVVGTGAIGGLIGARLLQAGNEVLLIDRPRRIEAIRRNGLVLIDRDGISTTLPATATSTDPASAGDSDFALLAVKAYDIPSLAPVLQETSVPVVTLQNGIPWWYFQRHGGKFENRILTSVDTDGSVSAAIDPSRVIGCVAYPAAGVTANGAIKHIDGSGLPIGELDGSITHRSKALSAAFSNSGFKSSVLEDIRSEIWLKAWGALSFNPISVLTGGTLRAICDHPETRDLAASMMREAEQVADHLGIRCRVPIESRIEGAGRVGEHKTSMLRDAESGRRLELDALLGSVREMGRLVGTPTPVIDTVYALTRYVDDSFSA